MDHQRIIIRVHEACMHKAYLGVELERSEVGVAHTKIDPRNSQCFQMVEHGLNHVCTVACPLCPRHQVNVQMRWILAA